MSLTGLNDILSFKNLGVWIDGNFVGLNGSVDNFTFLTGVERDTVLGAILPAYLKVSKFNGLIRLTFSLVDVGSLNQIDEFITKSHEVMLVGFDWESYYKTGSRDTKGIILKNAYVSSVTVSGRVGSDVVVTVEFVFNDFDFSTGAVFPSYDTPKIVSCFASSEVNLPFSVSDRVVGFTLNVRTNIRPLYVAGSRIPMGFKFGRFEFDLGVSFLTKYDSLNANGELVSSLFDAGSVEKFPSDVGVDFVVDAGGSEFSFSLSRARIRKLDFSAKVGEFVIGYVEFVSEMLNENMQNLVVSDFQLWLPSEINVKPI